MSEHFTSKTTQLIKPPQSVMKSNSAFSYNLYVSGDKAKILSYVDEFIRNVRYLLVKSSEPIIYREPLVIHEEINVEEWKKSITNTSSQNEVLLQKILLDFGFDQSDENISWLDESVNHLISIYEKKYKMKLPDESRSMIHNLLIRIAYDKLCLKLAE